MLILLETVLREVRGCFTEKKTPAPFEAGAVVG